MHPSKESLRWRRRRGRLNDLQAGGTPRSRLPHALCHTLQALSVVRERGLEE